MHVHQETEMRGQAQNHLINSAHVFLLSWLGLLLLAQSQLVLYPCVLKASLSIDISGL